MSDQPMTAPQHERVVQTHTDGLCPECEQGKHSNCSGHAWNYTIDDMVDCFCYASGHHF